MSEAIYNKLDLSDFILEFKSFFAREKPLDMQGDINQHKKFIDELSLIDFTPPKRIKNLNRSLNYLKKQGILKLHEIFEFVKIVWYFNYLKGINHKKLTREWMDKIVNPPEIVDIANYFDDEGNLKSSVDDRFIELESALKKSKQDIKNSLNRLFHTKKLQPYIVDSQIHYISESETILVRGGFNRVLKATVVSRSSRGFFYVLPEVIESLKKQQASLLARQDELIYEYERSISKIMSKLEKFLTYINIQFDRFDHYQARVNFAKIHNLEFIKPSLGSSIKLKGFAHPAIKDPKLIDIDFSKKILLVTGVNAGGKTMLLKSILSSVLLAKHLIPFRVNAFHSEICSFKEIIPVIDDPQNIKDDISTFAGRIREFTKLFEKKSFIAGIDEIELGTDADEAASLFKVILKKLMKKDIKIVITTHHKRLASMMATDDEVELLAAIYDLDQQRPTYDFLKGTIGKSYAFETALRYGISKSIIQEVKEEYGKDQEKLNELIQKNIDIEIELKNRLKKVDLDIEKNRQLSLSLKSQKEDLNESIKDMKLSLQKEYQEAIQEAKKAAKSQDRASIHRLLNRADRKKREAVKEIKHSRVNFKVGDIVKYSSNRGQILSIRKDIALIECSGVKMRVPLQDLKRSGNLPKLKQTSTIVARKPERSSIKLDLHGLHADEAIEKLDKYLSDALITGYDEIVIYHGVGSGRLAFAVKEFLKSYPKIKSFTDAPANMGGMGATLVKL
jgi:DNA mismatch repair protein MutS2